MKNHYTITKQEPKKFGLIVRNEGCLCWSPLKKQISNILVIGHCQCIWLKTLKKVLNLALVIKT